MKESFKSFFNPFKKKKEEKEEEKVIAKDGFIEIKNNIIIVFDNDEGGMKPILNIPENDLIEFFINGEKVIGEREVFSTDAFSFKVKEPTLHKETLEYRISDNKMFVLMKKTVKQGVQYQLEEQEKKNHLTLSVISLPYVSPTPIEQLKELIKDEPFKGEYLEENLLLLSTSEESIELEILKGKEPIEGKPAYYKRIVAETEFNFVTKGIDLAEYVEEIPPQNGINVYGEEVPIELKYELPKLGVGVELKEGKLVSTKEGRFSFTEKGIQIIPQLLIQRDLTPQDGMIMFDEGDVLIQGSACEGSFIRASGFVKIEGGAYKTTILSEHDVYIKGSVSHCQIYAGFEQLSYQKMTEYLKEYILNVQIFSEGIKDIQSSEITQVKQKEQLNKDCNAFLEKIKNRNELSFSLIEKNSSKELFTLYTTFLNIEKGIQQTFSINNRLKAKQMEFKRLVAVINLLIENIERNKTKELSKFEADSIDSSKVFSSGTVEVNGTGIYMSTIEAGKSITVVGGVKGGNLVAQDYVDVGKFKSLDPDHWIKVKNKNGYIRAGKRNPYTIFQVGDFIHENDDMEYGVYFQWQEKKKK